MDRSSDDLILRPSYDDFSKVLADIQVSWLDQIRMMGRLLVHDKLQVTPRAA